MAFKLENIMLGGMEITLVTYESDHMKVVLSSYGAGLWQWFTKDKEGRFENIVLGYDRLVDYLENEKFLGATVGPYAGRIHPPRFEMDGTIHTLEANFMNHAHLHSGKDNLTRKNFNTHLEGNTVTFALNPGATAYSGHTTHQASYTFTRDTITLIYRTETAKNTYTNLTNHSYFNLSGAAKRDILNHTLTLPSDTYLALDKHFMGTALKLVENTPFDFRKPTRLKTAIDELKHGPQMGLDHPFLLNEGTIVLHDPESGRTLELTTNQDVVVVYSNNFLIDAPLEQGVKDRPQLAICLECQHLPNDIHFSQAPNSFHPANTIHTQTTIYTIR